MFGLANAPRFWWRRLREILLGLGFQEMKLLPCVFVSRDADGVVNGLLAVHVDDVILCGDEDGTFGEMVAQLRKSLKFGKWEETEFEYTGRHIRQAADFSVYVSQPNYADMSIERIPTQTKRAHSDPCTAQEKGLLRSIAGAGCWLGRQTRPDLCFEVSSLQQSIPEANYGHVLDANTLRRRAREVKYEMKIPALPLDCLEILVATDASPGTMPRSGSQAGYLLMMVDPAIRAGAGNVVPVAWS